MRATIGLMAGLWPGLLANCFAAYLPVIGPGPLRFESLPEPVAVAPAVPVAIPAEPAPAAPTTNDSDAPLVPFPILAPPVPEANSQTNTVSSVPAPEASLNGTNNSTSALEPGWAKPQNDFISPQMMLHFFQRKFGETNAPETGVVVPVNFTPPSPGPRPASKATYVTP